jgi:hypothetical protein
MRNTEGQELRGVVPTRRAARFAATLALVGAVAVLALPAPAAALRSACTLQLVDCFETASDQSDWIRRWAAGIDCEVDYAECLCRFFRRC